VLRLPRRRRALPAARSSAFGRPAPSRCSGSRQAIHRRQRSAGQLSAGMRQPIRGIFLAASAPAGVAAGRARERAPAEGRAYDAHVPTARRKQDGAMAVPDFQTLMRPLLEEYATGGEQPIADVRAVLAAKFELTEEDLAERLPSGTAKTFNNRVGWAATYLYGVGLLARPRRSVYMIHRTRQRDSGGKPGADRPQRAVAVTRVRQHPRSPRSRNARQLRRERADGR
jgi:hypothetical protein